MYTEISFFIYQIENNPKLSQYTVGKTVGKQALLKQKTGSYWKCKVVNTNPAKELCKYLIKLQKHLHFESVSPLSGIFLKINLQQCENA